MSRIPDFSDSEMWVIDATLRERYGASVPTELAETELRLYKGSTQLVPGPTVYREADLQARERSFQEAG